MHNLRRNHSFQVLGWQIIYLFILTLWVTPGCTPPRIDPEFRNTGGPPEPKYAEVPVASEADPNTVKPEKKSTRKDTPDFPSSKTSKPENLDAQGDADGGTLGDLILTPLRTYGKVRVKIDDIQIQSQLNIFRAKNGGNPKDFTQYKKEILDPLGINPPELPSGDHYLYLPNKGRDGEVVVGSPR